MGYDFKAIILSLRLQYYLPFVVVSGLIFWYPPPQRVQANQGSNTLPVIKDSDPSTWPQPQTFPTSQKSQSTVPETTLPAPSPVPPIPLPPIDINRSSSGRSPSLNSASPALIPEQPTSIPSLTDNAAELEQAEGESPLNPPNIPSIISPYEPDEYRLTIGDTISVIAANIPEFSTENILRSDGSINLPVAGEIFLWDMTLQEAERAIKKHYMDAKVLQDPDISVRLLASSPLKIAIAGEINRPGAYDVPVLDKRLPTITDAIKVAGGIASEADLRNVEIFRHNRLGGQQLIRLNLFALYQEADLSQNITLRSGDRIIIPNAPVRPDEAQLIGAANISPDSMQVGILGEVLSPGIIQAPTHTSLNQSLILVGGFNSRAKKTVQLVRTNEDGSVSREKIKIDWNASVGDERNPILQHRDVILVGPNAIAKYSDFLDKAIGPINRTIPFIGILDLLFPNNNNR